VNTLQKLLVKLPVSPTNSRVQYFCHFGCNQAPMDLEPMLTHYLTVHTNEEILSWSINPEYLKLYQQYRLGPFKQRAKASRERP
jgi:hypothetical protein